MLENAWIEWLRRHAHHDSQLPRLSVQDQTGEGDQPKHTVTSPSTDDFATLLPTIKQGIGDDAAVVDCVSSTQLLVCADTIVDGVHFQSSEHPAELIGRKALAVNLSDIAAMGGRPLACLACVSIPSAHEAPAIDPQRLFGGIFTLANEFGVSLIGGDTTNTNDRLVLSVTLIGVAGSDIWTRNRAEVGDAIVVTGSLGGSILGHHLSFRPRVHEANYIANHYNVHAAIDLSDGLSTDLHRLCEASGAGASIFSDRIPIAKAAEEYATTTNRSPVVHALHDGEDFELLLTLPQDEANRLVDDANLELPVSIVGSIDPDEQVKLCDPSGASQLLLDEGFQHSIRGSD